MSTSNKSLRDQIKDAQQPGNQDVASEAPQAAPAPAPAPAIAETRPVLGYYVKRDTDVNYGGSRFTLKSKNPDDTPNVQTDGMLIHSLKQQGIPMLPYYGE